MKQAMKRTMRDALRRTWENAREFIELSFGKFGIALPNLLLECNH
jgi:hypothetical protein